MGCLACRKWEWGQYTFKKTCVDLLILVENAVWACVTDSMCVTEWTYSKRRAERPWKVSLSICWIWLCWKLLSVGNKKLQVINKQIITFIINVVVTYNTISSVKDVLFSFHLCLYFGWVVSSITQKSLNRFSQNLAGGWVSAQNRSD